MIVFSASLPRYFIAQLSRHFLSYLQRRSCCVHLASKWNSRLFFLSNQYLSMVVDFYLYAHELSKQIRWTICLENHRLSRLSLLPCAPSKVSAATNLKGKLYPSWAPNALKTCRKKARKSQQTAMRSFTLVRHSG